MVIAEIQSITYNEWLPIVLGPDIMENVSPTSFYFVSPHCLWIERYFFKFTGNKSWMA
jgi:hypothetical protein